MVSKWTLLAPAKHQLVSHTPTSRPTHTPYDISRAHAPSTAMSSRPTSILFFVLAFFGVLFQIAAAAPAVALERRDVYSPPVLYPHTGTVWYKGQTHNVTWDVSSPPVNITDKTGLITLRKSGIPTPLILADGFDILLGRVEVKVPWVIEGSDYSVVLFGDSGNWSEDFTIEQ